MNESGSFGHCSLCPHNTALPLVELACSGLQSTIQGAGHHLHDIGPDYLWDNLFPIVFASDLAVRSCSGFSNTITLDQGIVP